MGYLFEMCKGMDLPNQVIKPKHHEGEITTLVTQKSVLSQISKHQNINKPKLLYWINPGLFYALLF